MLSILHRLSFIVLTLMLLQTPAWAKKEPLRLAPTSKWVINYSDDSCRLGRKFGEGDGVIFLLFERFAPGDEFRLTVSGKPVKTRLYKGEVAIRFGPSEDRQKPYFMRGSMGADRPALLISGNVRLAAESKQEEKARKAAKSEYGYKHPLIGQEREAAVNYLSIGKPLRQTVVVELGAMDKPFAALSACVDELLTHWGIDTEKHKALKRKVMPKSSPGKWVISRDYPTDMLQAGQSAIVEFRLNVDVAGKPTACHIQLTTRPKEFDDAVCKSIMKRAKFLPALDSSGNPVASYWQNTVRFTIR